MLAMLVIGTSASGCGGDGTNGSPSVPSPTAGIYDEFLEARKLAVGLTARLPNVDPVAREQQIAKDRHALRNLEAGVASKRALLADAHRDVPADQPNESLYFRIWSGYLGDGDRPVFQRTTGGGIVFSGIQLSKDAALQCAVPARLPGSSLQPFLECLTTRQGAAAPVTSATAR